MPASVPTNIVHGTDIDLTVGPAADLSKCYYDGGIEIKPGHAKKNEYQNYLAVTDGMNYATPTFEISVPVIFKRENGTFATAHPGTGFSRSIIACASEKGAHGFPMSPSDAGYFVLDAISSTQEVGLHRKAKLDLKLFGFSTSAAISGGV